MNTMVARTPLTTFITSIPQNNSFEPLKTAESRRAIIIPPPWSLRLAEIAKQRTEDQSHTSATKARECRMDRKKDYR